MIPAIPAANEVGFAKVPGDLSGLSGEVYLTGQDTEGGDCHVTAEWEWLDGDEKNILAVNGLLNFDPADLIAQADQLNAWRQSTITNAKDGPREDVYVRSNDELSVRGWHRKGSAGAYWPELAPYEAGLIAAGSAAVILYGNINPHARVRHDTGWQLLRYQPGERFSEHIDAVSGDSLLARRRLSLLVYLNDDYEGGETTFPRQGLIVEPKAGTIVIFPAGLTHPHVGATVREGTKYAVVSWYM